MGLFDGLSTPKWISPMDQTWLPPNRQRNSVGTFCRVPAKAVSEPSGRSGSEEQDRAERIAIADCHEDGTHRASACGAGHAEALGMVVSQESQWLC